MSFDSPQKSPLMSNVSCVQVFLDCGVLLTVSGVSQTMTASVGSKGNNLVFHTAVQGRNKTSANDLLGNGV